MADNNNNNDINENSELHKDEEKQQEKDNQKPEQIKNQVENVKNKYDNINRVRDTLNKINGNNTKDSKSQLSNESNPKKRNHNHNSQSAYDRYKEKQPQRDAERQAREKREAEKRAQTENMSEKEKKKKEKQDHYDRHNHNDPSKSNASIKRQRNERRAQNDAKRQGLNQGINAGTATSSGATAGGTAAGATAGGTAARGTAAGTAAGGTAAGGAAAGGAAAGGAAGGAAAGGAAAAGTAVAAPVILIIVIIVLVIIFVIGIILYFQNMPGQVLGKIKEIATNFTVAIRSKINGDQTNVSKEDEIALAQYLENMGYDVEGYGFADVTYSEDENNDTYGARTSSGKAKEITAVTKDSKSKNYLKDYMAADQSTYFKATDNIAGFFKSIADNFKSVVDGSNNNSNLATSADYSTGMLEVDNVATIFDTTKSDSSKHVLTIKGGKYNYSFGLDGWTSKYGRPLELFLALHLSTMMPDLTDHIATDKAFNTKVHISFQNTYLYAKNMNITTDKGKTVVKDDVFKGYLKYVKHLFEVAKSQLEKEKAENQSKLDKATSEGKKNDAATAKTAVEQDDKYIQKTQEAIDFLTEILKDSKDKDKQKEIENKREEIIINIKTSEGSLPSIFQSAGYISAGDICVIPENTPLSGNGSTYLTGFTDTQLNELVELYVDIARGKQFYLPLITRVSRNWFWDGNKEEEKGTEKDDENNVYFTKSDDKYTGVYKTAQAVKKWVTFTPNESSSLKDFEINIDGLILAGDSNGIFYQVNEPYLTKEPNPELLALFKKKYYKYDGTEETAHRIKVAKALDNDKEKYYYHGEKTQITDDEKTEYENKTLAQKEKPSFGTKKDTLSAFEILKNMDTEDSETVYRMLKQFISSKSLSEVLGEDNTLSASDLTENLKQILIWPFDKDLSKSPDAPGTTSKDKNDYGLVISDVEGLDFLAPISCKVKKVEGTTVTLKLGKLSKNADKALKLKYKDDFYSINDDLLDGWTMVVKGISGAENGKKYKRGEKIGTSSDKVTIVLQRVNKTVVGGKNDTTEDNIEDYMNSSYTLTDEKGYTERGNEDGIADPNAPIIDEDEFYYNNGNYDGTYSDVDARNVDVGKIQKQVYKLLTTTQVTNKPLNEKAACAIMGIIKNESGFNPNATNPNDGGYGLIQWTNGRRTKLENWLSKNGYANNSVEGQIKYFFYELKKSYGSGTNYNIYDYLINQEHTLDEYLLYFFGHAEAGTNIMPGTEAWTRPYNKETNPTIPKKLFENRLADAKGFYNKRDELAK